MNDFEKSLTNRLKSEVVPSSNTEKMWKELNKRRVSKNMKRRNKTFITAAASVLVLATGFTFGPYLTDASGTLINNIFGSEEEIHKVDPVAGAKEYQELEQMLQVAQTIFSESELETFSSLMYRQMELMKKATTVVHNERQVDLNKLTTEEQAELKENEEQLQTYLSRIDTNGEHTLKEAKALANFPFHHPSYIPEGYELESETTIGKKQPIVELKYMKGEFGFTIKQSSILQADEDDFSLWSFNDVETYKINDYSISFSKLDGSENVQGMKVVVPATAQNGEYQLFMIADLLTKEEMEKILLSLLP